jgi:hypothetical protein
MPNIVGTSLKTSEPIELVDLLKGKISLVAVSGTRFGEEHTETFTTPFLKKWPVGQGDSKVQLVELNIQENPLKAGLVRMMVPFVKKTIPEERHVSVAQKHRSIEPRRQAFDGIVWFSHALSRLGKLCTPLQVYQASQGSIEYVKLLHGICLPCRHQLQDQMGR